MRLERSSTKPPAVVSCADVPHEVLESLRWARQPIASGTAKPNEIAIARANTTALQQFAIALLQSACPIRVWNGIFAAGDRRPNVPTPPQGLPGVAVRYCFFAGAPGSTAATPSGLMLKAKNINGSLPGFPHWCTRAYGS